MGDRAGALIAACTARRYPPVYRKVRLPSRVWPRHIVEQTRAVTTGAGEFSTAGSRVLQRSAIAIARKRTERTGKA